MATQVLNGKAFEWAVALEIENQSGFAIEMSTAAINAKFAYSQISQKKAAHFITTASRAVAHILEREKPQLIKNNFKIKIASDTRGVVGDVRDVIIFNDTVQIGFSCKTNHDDLKHSRLSDKLDFVSKWGLSTQGCSQEYWDKIKPVFGTLRAIKRNSNRAALFADLEDKPQRFYWPVLDAFTDELTALQINQNQSKLCSDLLSYLIGKNDFYKIISLPTEVIIQAFNFNGTLNTSKSKFPDSIVGIDRVNGGQYSKTVRFSRGYSINFRIHNGDSKVVPSLKFAVSAISFPPKEIYTQNISV
jgi:HaeIII restriction endonuclease